MLLSACSYSNYGSLHFDSPSPPFPHAHTLQAKSDSKREAALTEVLDKLSRTLVDMEKASKIASKINDRGEADAYYNIHQGLHIQAQIAHPCVLLYVHIYIYIYWKRNTEK